MKVIQTMTLNAVFYTTCVIDYKVTQWLKEIEEEENVYLNRLEFLNRRYYTNLDQVQLQNQKNSVTIRFLKTNGNFKDYVIEKRHIPNVHEQYIINQKEKATWKKKF